MKKEVWKVKMTKWVVPADSSRTLKTEMVRRTIVMMRREWSLKIEDVVIKIVVKDVRKVLHVMKKGRPKSRVTR